MAEPFILMPNTPRRPTSPGWSVAALCCLIVVASLIGIGCAGGQPPGEGQGEGPGHRPQQLALSPQQELDLGRKAYREVLSDPKKYGRVVPADRPESRRILAVTQRIIKAAEIEPL